jgi:hypothetical protein
MPKFIMQSKKSEYLPILTSFCIYYWNGQMPSNQALNTSGTSMANSWALLMALI